VTLGDQLDELRKNILRDRSNLFAGDDDRLWDDNSLLRYIKDGERKFSRETLCLRDSTTPECTQIKLRTGIATYPLHPSVISVLSARFDVDTGDLQRAGHSIVAQNTPPEWFNFDPMSVLTLQPGRPIAYYTDETLVYARSSRVTLTVYPAPSSTENGLTLYLRTIRVPMTVYSVDTLDNESEVPEDYQLDCLEWAAYRALRHFDADAGAPTPSQHHKDAYDEAVKKAVKQLKQSMFAQIGMRYGTNGLSYVR